MADRNYETEYKWWENSEKLIKLEQAFAIGCTDKEACSYAEITEHQLYYYQDVVNPQFAVKKQELKEKPILKAKQTIVKSLDQPEHAKWYLERKSKDEFSTRSELTGKDGDALIPDKQSKEKADEALDIYLNGQDKGNIESGESEGATVAV